MLSYSVRPVALVLSFAGRRPTKWVVECIELMYGRYSTSTRQNLILETMCLNFSSAQSTIRGMSIGFESLSDSHRGDLPESRGNVNVMAVLAHG